MTSAVSFDEGGSGIFRTGRTEGLYAVDMAGPDGGVMIPYWDRMEAIDT